MRSCANLTMIWYDVMKSPLTVPLLLSDVTPVFADREYVFHKEAAVVFSIG